MKNHPWCEDDTKALAFLHARVREHFNNTQTSLHLGMRGMCWAEHKGIRQQVWDQFLVDLESQGHVFHRYGAGSLRVSPRVTVT